MFKTSRSVAISNHLMSSYFAGLRL